MKTFLIILILAPLTFSQWEFGASYKIKSDIPENGIGINVSRNLPYQGATFGIKVRAEVNLFRQTETVNTSERIGERKFLSEDYNLNIIGNYYFRNFSPYFGLGIGYGKQSSGAANWQGFILSLLVGNKFPISDLIKPYIEIQGFNYIADFERRIWGREFSNYQFRFTFGLNVSINTLGN